jgi:cold shock CspA family protein
MAKGREVFNKKEREKAMLKKRKDKEQKKEERKASSGKGKGLENMFAYVDAYGNLVSEPPDPQHKEDVNLEDIRISTARKEDSGSADAFCTGTVSYFNESRGFGFINEDGTNQRILIHISNLEAPVRENDRVSFNKERGPRGFVAVNARLLQTTNDSTGES